MIWCSLFNPAIDALYSLADFETGKTYTGVHSRIDPAGKGVNVARIISALGEETAVIGIMPEASRGMYELAMKGISIGASFFPVAGAARINVTISEADGGRTTHISAQNQKLASGMQSEFIDFLEQQMKTKDLWALSGSVPDGFERGLYQKVIAILKKKKIGCLLDSSDAALTMGIRAKPDMVKPNLSELESYFGEKIKGIRHIALRGKRLLDLGIPRIFISLGSDGLIALQGNDCLLCSAPSVKAVDTVGCGDALVAGLMVGWKRSFSFTEMCRMAVACGVSKALHLGAGIIDINEVWQIMEDVSIESV